MRTGINLHRALGVCYLCILCRDRQSRSLLLLPEASTVTVRGKDRNAAVLAEIGICSPADQVVSLVVFTRLLVQHTYLLVRNAQCTGYQRHSLAIMHRRPEMAAEDESRTTFTP